MGAEYLQYYIRETRQLSVSRRDEQQNDMLDYLQWMLAQALQRGQTIAMPPLVWHLAATTTPERMQALLWYGLADGPPHLIVHVASGDPPRCEASRAGLLQQGADFAAAVLDASYLEQGLAWAWLEGRAARSDTRSKAKAD